MDKGTFVVGILCAAVLALPGTAEAFCGFYVSQSEGSLYNNATRVAMMRNGKQTVMSMQNNYAGPPEDFAMVVPVPEVLEKENVKTLDDKVFNRLDRLTSPRLVEYWQKDPCYKPPERKFDKAVRKAAASKGAGFGPEAAAKKKVKVEAKFDVGEYEVVVLSADESTALDTWLRNHNYNIPDGAPEYFRPYIEQGSYFFVAKVNLDKVEYKDGEAILSPLRFHYETDDFKLPVRLGLINSKGSQDLIVYLLGKRQRYRVANYPNLKIPTNLPVKEKVKNHFPAFYDKLFSRLLDDQPEAVVTEYAWTATSCDPCPVEPLERSHLRTLGTDVIDGKSKAENKMRRRPPMGGTNWTVTRLHTRYTKDTLGEDLQFEKAPAIRGGRGEPEGREGTMDQQTARESSRNNFQARYYIAHGWSGDIDCEDPNWNRWGGPPNGSRPEPSAAGDLGFSSASGDITLASTVEQASIPQIGEISEGEGDKSTDQSANNGTNMKSDKTDEPREKKPPSGPKDGNRDVLPWILLVILFPLAAYGAYKGLE